PIGERPILDFHLPPTRALLLYDVSDKHDEALILKSVAEDARHACLPDDNREVHHHDCRIQTLIYHYLTFSVAERPDKPDHSFGWYGQNHKFWFHQARHLLTLL